MWRTSGWWWRWCGGRGTWRGQSRRSGWRGWRRAGGVLACVLLARGQTAAWRDSGTLFRQALAVQEDNAVAHGNLGAWLVTEGRGAEAFGHLRRSVEIQPRNNTAHANLATLLLETGNQEAAERHYRMTLVDFPWHTVALNNLAWMLATDPAAPPVQAEEALGLARKAIEGVGGSPSAALLDTLAVALAATGDYAGAAAAAGQALAALENENGDEELTGDGERLELYRAGRPYRE
jgi:Tfp pilus assembly protein PilF